MDNMTPLESILEDSAELVRAMLNTHWTVLLIPVLIGGAYMVGAWRSKP